MRFSREQIAVLILLVIMISSFNLISYRVLTGEAIFATVSFYINSPPYLNRTIPNQTWQQDMQLVGIDLDDHFVDPEGEVMTYDDFGTVFITVSIDSVTHVVTFTPPGGWSGIEYVWFNATDPPGARGTSNMVMLNVTPSEPVSPPDSGSGQGAAGGGPLTECIEQWVCKDWSPCAYGIQERTCRDLAHCGTNHSMPSFLQKCHVPSCSDRIQNQEETGIDCGGPCPPCKTCFDDIQNCHNDLCEVGIDCGGPCLPCQLKAIKDVEFLTAPWISLAIILIIIFSIEAYLYGKKKKLREEQLPLSPKRMKEAVRKLLSYSEFTKKKDKEK